MPTRGDTATTASSTTTSGSTSTVISSSAGTETHTSTSQQVAQHSTDTDPASITSTSTAATSTADGDSQISTSSFSLTHSSFTTPTSELTASAISPSFVARSSRAVSSSSTAMAVPIPPSSTNLLSTSTSSADASTGEGHSHNLIVALSSVLGVFVLVATVLAYFLWNRRRHQARSADASHENGGREPQNRPTPEEQSFAKGSSGSRGAEAVSDGDSSTIIDAYATTSLAGELGSPRSATSPSFFPSSREVVSSQKTSDILSSAGGTRGEHHSKHASHGTRGEPAPSLGSTLPSASQRIPSGLSSDEVEPREPWASDDREEEPPPYEPRTQD